MCGQRVQFEAQTGHWGASSGQKTEFEAEESRSAAQVDREFSLKLEVPRGEQQRIRFETEGGSSWTQKKI